MLRALVALLCVMALPALADDLHPRTLAVPPHGVRAASSVHRQSGGAATALPIWTRNITINGTLYQPVFVGTDPQAGSATTTVTVTIVPVRFVLSDGTVFDPTWPRVNGRRPFSQSALRATLSSPIFQPATFTLGGTTYGTAIQFGDAVMRASWWDTVSASAPAWHVNLQAAVQPMLTLTVPAQYGALSSRHRRMAIIDMTWFGGNVDSLIQAADPGGLLMFLFDQVVLCGDPNPPATQTTCSYAYLGYHSANGSGVGGIPYAFVSYFDPGSWDWVSDVSIISHEIAEFLNNPFVTNTSPVWPFGPIGSIPTCMDQLETGDPIEDLGSTPYAPYATFQVATLGTIYSLQNQALVPWFMQDGATGPTGSSLTTTNPNNPYTLSPVPLPEFTTYATCP